MTRTHRMNDHPAGIESHRTGLVRQAVGEDIPDLVAIHQKAFSTFFLTRLGGEFLRRYYALVLSYRSGIVLVSEWQGVLTGFVCGFVEPAKFYEVMWRSRWGFVLPALYAVVRDPSMATGVVHGVQRIHASASNGQARSCELSSIAVVPEAAGNGLGKELMQAFLGQARCLKAEYVYLTTDADNNEAANALYRQVGFQQTHRFLQRKGRWMNEYMFREWETNAVPRYA